MTCKELIDFLDDHLENRLEPDVRLVFDEHLSLCRACRDYLASYRETLRLGRAAFAIPEQQVDTLPEGLIQAVLAAKRAQSESSSPVP